MLVRYPAIPLPLTSGIDIVSLYTSSLIDNMKETVTELLQSSLEGWALPKAAIIILQIICFIGIASPYNLKK